MRTQTRTVLVVLTLLLPASVFSQSVPVGLWNFDAPADLTQADVGNDLVLVGSHAAAEGAAPGDGAARLDVGDHYICDHGISANGGGALVNEYTIVMDVRTEGRGLWHCLLQTNQSNSNDGEVFIDQPGLVGVSATGYSYPRMLDAKTWYRLSIVVDNGSRYEVYADGIPMLDGTPQAVDGRFALDPTVLFFADENGEDGEIDVSRVALYDEALSAGEIADLGGLGGATHFVTRPFLQNIKRDGISIMWETEELETAYVEYGLDSGYGSTQPATSVDSGNGTRIYTAALTELVPESSYHYRAVAGTSASNDGTFSTAPNGDADFSFGVWSDSQGYNHGDYERDPTEPTRAMFDHMTGEGIDLAVSCGDLAENGGSYTDARVFYVDRPVTHLGGQGVPFFNAWGNHDAGSTAVMRLFADLPSKDRGSPFHAGYGSYSFEYGGCHFICIDYQLESGDIPEWVEQDLQSPEAQNARFTFLFVHRPPYCERWISGVASLRDDLVPLMEQYGVDVCFSGHTHAYGRGYQNSVYYCITGGGSWLDHVEPLVYDWPHMTVGGYHDVAPDIEGGLVHEYVKVDVTGETMTARMMAFDPDGTFREVLDTFTKDTDLTGIDGSVHAISDIDPTDPDILYTGRWNDSTPAEPWCYWIGSSIIANFEGTGMAATMDAGSGGTPDYLRVIIDSDAAGSVKIPVDGSTATYTLASGLTDDVHKIEIIKETDVGNWTLHGLELDDGKTLATPPARPSHRIEFYGDSNLAGYSLEHEQNNSGTHLRGSYNGYAGITSRMLDAEYTNVSRSGARISDINGVYDRYAYFLPNPVWDFDGLAPDVVVVNLGANDVGRPVNQIKNNYNSFLDDLRATHPDAHIMLYNSWGWDYDEPANYIHEVIADRDDPDMSFATFPWIFEQWHGCEYDHAGMAQILADHLTATLGWAQVPRDVMSGYGVGGNVANGSFEEQAPFGGYGWRYYTDTGVSRVYDPAGAHDGDHYLRLEDGASSHQPIPAVDGQTFVLQVWMRGAESGDQMDVTMDFRDQEMWTTPLQTETETFALTPHWAEYSMMATAPTGASNPVYHMRVTVTAGSCVVDIDAVAMSEAAGVSESKLPSGVLLSASPNPFNPFTVISYDVPEETSVSLLVYDVSGRVVRVLEDQTPRERGAYTAMWDGRSESGERVASGVYFCELTSGETGVRSSIVLLK